MDNLGMIKWFKDISIQDIAIVGGKNASLGEMYRELKSKNINVPNGFCLTVEAYDLFIESNALKSKINNILSVLDTNDIKGLRKYGNQIRKLILNAEFPNLLGDEISFAYKELGENANVAVRSSATAEDLPEASFAGQQETYLNITGIQDLITACQKCFASLFTDRAISYRIDKNISPNQLALSIGVQKMVRSDLASSGVMFSIDTESGFENVVLINSAYGLGENIVQGVVNPDEFYVFKGTLNEKFIPIIKKSLGSKKMKMIYSERNIKNVEVSDVERNKYSISDKEIIKLAKWACHIENHYSAKYNKKIPMDIEWAKDGQSGELFIVQARPETVKSQKKIDYIEKYILKEKGPVIMTGRSVGEKICTGRVKIIQQTSELDQLEPGEILVTDKTDPDWEPVMKKASAIITNRGGRTCHAAIVSRELGVPAIIGTENGTEILQDGDIVTINCAEGDTGFVYKGKLKFDIEHIHIRNLKRPNTSIMMNIANPDEAFRQSFFPNDGVGLARMEFIISHSIQIHPMALIYFDTLTDEDLKEKINRLTFQYPDKKDYFIEKLAEGIAMIAAAFYPKEVIVRLSDFKSNEYAELIGGSYFEPREENPMIGFRGASRYYDPRYRQGFALECLAIKKVREEMGLLNVKVMVPFCRTIKEGEKVILEMNKNGLRREENGLEIYVMCEIPSNVILARDFLKIFDGFSIGSNDLTQLILGIDRDSELISHLFDERNDAVKAMIGNVIEIANDMNKKIGFCGQAPSDYPEYIEFLIAHQVDSISLNPDAVIKVTEQVIQLEKEYSILNSQKSSPFRSIEL